MDSWLAQKDEIRANVKWLILEFLRGSKTLSLTFDYDSQTNAISIRMTEHVANAVVCCGLCGVHFLSSIWIRTNGLQHSEASIPPLNSPNSTISCLVHFISQNIWALRRPPEDQNVLIEISKTPPTSSPSKWSLKCFVIHLFLPLVLFLFWRLCGHRIRRLPHTHIRSIPTPCTPIHPWRMALRSQCVMGEKILLK